jgi:hypothetical protein
MTVFGHNGMFFKISPDVYEFYVWSQNMVGGDTYSLQGLGADDIESDYAQSRLQ